MNRSICICILLLTYVSRPAAAEARTLDLPYSYLAASTFIPAYNPDLDPDMDQDGAPDLSQANLLLLVTILADTDHPDHDDTHAAFEHNETLAREAILTGYSPIHTFIEPVAALWGAYMTIRGGGAYMGPTQSGMAGLAEFLWNMLGFDVSAAPFMEQDWIHAAAFGGPQTATLLVTNGGLVTEGDRVEMVANAAGAQVHRWYKDDGLIGEGGAMYEIPAASLDDAGAYHCEIEVNGGATLETAAVQLVVSEAPGAIHGRATALLAGVGLVLLALAAMRRRKAAE